VTSRDYPIITYRAVAICITLNRIIADLSAYGLPRGNYGESSFMILADKMRLADLVVALLLWGTAGWLTDRLVLRGYLHCDGNDMPQAYDA